MAKKPTRQPRDPGAPEAPRKRRTAVTAGLLLAVAAIVAATVYVAVAPPWDATRDPLPEPGPSQAEKARTAVEQLLARADAMDPKAGPHAVLAKRQGYEAALELARTFIRLTDPRDVVVRPLLAQVQLRLGRLPEAERTIDDLLRLSPGSARGLWMKGELVQARGGKGAMDFFRRAAESDQADGRIWAGYGMALLTRGREEDAETYLLRAERAGQADHQTLLGLAMLAMKANRFARAEELLQRLAAGGRASVRVLSMLAEAQKEGDKLPEAERTLRRALETERSPALQLQLADVLVLRRRRAEAAEMYARAAEHPAVEPVAAFKAARCYYLLDKYALAMKYIDRAADAAPTPEVLQWRKRIENARFGEPATTKAPAFRLPRGGGADDAPAPAGGLLKGLLGEGRPPATQPAGLPE